MRGYNLVATVLKVVERLWPTVVIALTAAKAINAAIRPYSIAVAPRSSLSRVAIARKARIASPLLGELERNAAPIREGIILIKRRLSRRPRQPLLGPGDLVQVECGYGNTELLTAQMLATAGVEPEQKVLDLRARMRCRECDAKGRIGRGDVAASRLLYGVSSGLDRRGSREDLSRPSLMSTALAILQTVIRLTPPIWRATCAAFRLLLRAALICARFSVGTL